MCEKNDYMQGIAVANPFLLIVVFCSTEPSPRSPLARRDRSRDLRLLPVRALVDVRIPGRDPYRDPVRSPVHLWVQ